MNTRQAQILACPLDGLPLKIGVGTITCPRRHNYDIARNGYCNLLVVQQKASKDPGDSKEMIAARRRFLNAGYYAAIAERIYLLSCNVLPDNSLTPSHVVDAGCGEGYYLERFAALAHKNDRPTATSLVGMDVSKWAVKAATTRDFDASWLVASNRQPPFLPRSIDLIWSIFGFPHWQGFASVLAESGHILLVDPGPEHLIELRQIIYPSVSMTPPSTLEGASKAGYNLVAEENVRYEVELADLQTIQDLLLMTPHGARITPERRSAVTKLERLTVTIDVALRLIAKRK